MNRYKIYQIEDKPIYRTPILEYCSLKQLDYKYFAFEYFDKEKNNPLVTLILKEIDEYDPDVIILDLAWNHREEIIIESVLTDVGLDNCNKIKNECQVFDFINRLNLKQKFLPVIILTDYSKEIQNIFDKIYDKRADFIIKKKKTNLKAHDLLNILDNDLNKCFNAKKFFSGIDNYLASASSSNVELYSKVMNAAAVNTDLLLLGGTGVGKNALAKAIHKFSDRANTEMVTLQISSLAESILESELFGSVKGAFTDAKDNKTGYIEKAEGRILFLDEIGELTLSIQAKLLTFLTTREYSKVGETQTRKANVRIIAATNKNLKTEITAGRFREDLYYRLNQFTITIPLLGHRIYDIPVLINHFFEIYTDKYKKAKRNLNWDEIEPFLKYSYSGNNRQIENIISKAVILNCNPLSEILNDKEILADLKSVNNGLQRSLNELISDLFDYAISNNTGIDNIMDSIQKYFYEKTLEICNGGLSTPTRIGLSASARMLKLNEDTFKYRATKLGININH